MINDVVSMASGFAWIATGCHAIDLWKHSLSYKLICFLGMLLGHGRQKSLFWRYRRCCSASFDRLTMGSQCHPLQHRWGAFLAYKVRCASDIWWCSRAAGGQNHDISGIGRCCSASFDRLNMGLRRRPLAHRWEAFPSYKVRCASDIWVCYCAAAVVLARRRCWIA